MTIGGFMERLDFNKRLNDIEDILKDAYRVLNQIESSEKRIDGKYDFTSAGLFRGNFLGDFLRGNKVSSVNRSIDDAQQAILDFHARLLLFDQSLADKLKLPSKMSEFSAADGKLSDIAVRTNMRLKEFDVTKAKRSLQTIIRRLEGERKKAAYELEKEAELYEYHKDKTKGRLK